MRRRLVIVLLLAGAVALGGIFATRPPSSKPRGQRSTAVGVPVGMLPAAMRPEASTQPMLYLVPIGSDRSLEWLREQLAHYYGAVAVLPAIRIPALAEKSPGGRLNAELLLDGLEAEYGQRTLPSRRFVIGIVAGELYDPAHPKTYPFAQRRTVVAVVSAAMFDPHLAGIRMDAADLKAITRSRIEKLVARTHQRLQDYALTSEPRSVLFDGLKTADDLDFTTLDGSSPPESAWLRAANRACTANGELADAARRQFDMRFRTEYVGWLYSMAARARAMHFRLDDASPDSLPASRFTDTLGDLEAFDLALANRLLTRWSDHQFYLGISRGNGLLAAAHSYALQMGSRTCASVYGPSTRSSTAESTPRGTPA